MHQAALISRNLKPDRMSTRSLSSVSSDIGDSQKSDKIRVVARIRPLSKKEKREGCTTEIFPLISEDLRFDDDLHSLSSMSFDTASTSVHHPSAAPINDVKQYTNIQSPKIDLSSFISTPPPSRRKKNGGNQSITVGKSEKKYDFDAVFGPSASQQEVYDVAVGEAVLGNVFRGKNTTIIAYGQTGSGKTHTMGTSMEIGDAKTHEESMTMAGDRSFDALWAKKKRIENKGHSVSIEKTSISQNDNVKLSTPTKSGRDDGLCAKAINDLFQARKWHTGDSVIRLTYLEIYNDEIKDLLSAKEEISNLRLQDSGSTVSVKGLKSIEVNSPEEVMHHMQLASQRRTTHSTNMNSKSSRSHAVCVLHVSLCPSLKKNDGKALANSKVITAKLTLVDLAGSERMKQTGAEGLQKQEGININKDLFVLGQVISALAKKKKGGFVPYRESKLTRLLRDSLGGNCCTILLACVSPADKNVAESENTLQYAQTTRKIQNKNVQSTVALSMSPSEGAALRRENKRLKALLDDLMEQCSPRGGGKLTTIAASLKKEQEYKNQAKNEIWNLKESIEQIIRERDGLMQEVDRIKSETTQKIAQIKEEYEGRRDISSEFVSLKRIIEQLTNEKENLGLRITTLAKDHVDEKMLLESSLLREIDKSTSLQNEINELQRKLENCQCHSQSKYVISQETQTDDIHSLESEDSTYMVSRKGRIMSLSLHDLNGSVHSIETEKTSGSSRNRVHEVQTMHNLTPEKDNIDDESRNTEIITWSNTGDNETNSDKRNDNFKANSDFEVGSEDGIKKNGETSYMVKYVDEALEKKQKSTPMCSGEVSELESCNMDAYSQPQSIPDMSQCNEIDDNHADEDSSTTDSTMLQEENRDIKYEDEAVAFVSNVVEEDQNEISGASNTGTMVQSRFGGGDDYHVGRIVSVRVNGTYDIEYEDGRKEIGVLPEFVKPILKVRANWSAGGWSASARPQHDMLENRHLRRENVNNNYIRPESSDKIIHPGSSDTLDVRCKDDETDLSVEPSMIQKIDDNSEHNNRKAMLFEVEMFVKVLYICGSDYRVGKISAAHMDGTYDIVYNDGDGEYRIPCERIMNCSVDNEMENIHSDDQLQTNQNEAISRRSISEASAKDTYEDKIDEIGHIEEITGDENSQTNKQHHNNNFTSDEINIDPSSTKGKKERVIDNIDVCLVCIGDDPPTLPLMEEPQTLGIELIHSEETGYSLNSNKEGELREKEVLRYSLTEEQDIHKEEKIKKKKRGRFTNIRPFKRTSGKGKNK